MIGQVNSCIFSSREMTIRGKEKKNLNKRTSLHPPDQSNIDVNSFEERRKNMYVRELHRNIPMNEKNFLLFD